MFYHLLGCTHDYTYHLQEAATLMCNFTERLGGADGKFTISTEYYNLQHGTIQGGSCAHGCP